MKSPAESLIMIEGWEHGHNWRYYTEAECWRDIPTPLQTHKGTECSDKRNLRKIYGSSRRISIFYFDLLLVPVQRILLSFTFKYTMQFKKNPVPSFDQIFCAIP